MEWNYISKVRVMRGKYKRTLWFVIRRFEGTGPDAPVACYKHAHVALAMARQFNGQPALGALPR